MFLPDDYGGHQSGFDSLELGLVVCKGDIELPDESHQERLHLDDTIQSDVFSVPGRVNDVKGSTHATLHAMQLLTPPENVTLSKRTSQHSTAPLERM